MPVNWDEFEPATPATIDWGDFEPAESDKTFQSQLAVKVPEVIQESGITFDKIPELSASEQEKLDNLKKDYVIQEASKRVDESPIKGIGRGFRNVAIGTAEFAKSPEGLGLIAATALSPTVGFGIMAGLGAKAIGEGTGTLSVPGASTQQATEHILNMSLMALGARQAAKLLPKAAKTTESAIVKDIQDVSKISEVPEVPREVLPLEKPIELPVKESLVEKAQPEIAPEIKPEKVLTPEATEPVRLDTETQGAIATAGPQLAPAPAPIPTLEPKSQRQIIEDLAKGLDLPIRFGRLRTSKFAGYFLKTPDLIGSKKANDIPIVSHEVGHKLDKTFGFSSDPAINAELNVLGDPSVPGSRSSWTPSKSADYRLGEGTAEFVRLWLTDPPRAASLAPKTESAFRAALDANKDIGDVMRQAQSDIQVWRTAEPQARLRSHISTSNPNKTRYTVDQLTRDLVDDLHFLRLAVDDAKLKGSDIAPSKDVYLNARNLRGTFGMADTFIQKGIADFKTKEVKLGTSLEDALKPVSGRISDFRDWIVAKRAQELHARGKETGLVDTDVSVVAAKFNSDPAFQSAFNAIKQWQDSVLQYAVDAGLVEKGAPATAKTPATGAELIRELNQDYVPFHRVFEIGAGEPPAVGGIGTGRGLNAGKPGSLKGLKGSPRDIVDPLEAMIGNAYSLITAAEKSYIHRSLADMSKLPGMGKWVEHIATPKQSVKVGIDKVRKQLEDAGADLSKVPDDTLLSFYQNSGIAPFGENIIKIVKDGKPEFYRLDKDLFNTFHALDLEDAGRIVRMLSAPSQLLRAGVTLEPGFAIANALRDTFSAAILSKYTAFPFQITLKGVNAMLREPKLVAEWAASGGKNSIEASYFDRTKLQKFLREKITKDMTPADQALVFAKSPLTALRWLTTTFEEATRIGEYKTAFEQLRKSGMPEGDARRLAAFESRDRQDFAKGGAITKPVRSMAAFWNAGLQSQAKLIQAFKTRPFQTSVKGLAFITIPKLIEQAINWNDQDYWDRPQWERDLFFMIPVGKDESNHTKFAKLPTPFELGIIFGTLPGRFLEWAKFNKPEVMQSFPEMFLRNSIPNPTPQWMQVLYADVLSGEKGWDVWRGKPVVPDSVAKLPPELQFTKQTSATAKKVGEIFGVSPMKIDHAIGGLTGGMGKVLTGRSIPGQRFVAGPASSFSQSVDDFYNTLNLMEKEAQREKVTEQDAKMDISMLPNFRSAEEAMSKLRKQAREAKTEAEEREYREEILQIARDIMKEYRQ